jgi:hypothetical protein
MGATANPARIAATDGREIKRRQPIELWIHRLGRKHYRLAVWRKRRHPNPNLRARMQHLYASGLQVADPDCAGVAAPIRQGDALEVRRYAKHTGDTKDLHRGRFLAHYPLPASADRNGRCHADQNPPATSPYVLNGHDWALSKTRRYSTSLGT